MAKRGVIYIVWGQQPRKALERSISSLSKVHPELPIKVFEVDDLKGPMSLLQKSKMSDLSPFDETLYLDADTVIFDRLDFGFEKAVQFGISCSVCENPWAKRYKLSISGDVVEYNTGVLFFTKAVKELFGRWKELSNSADSSIVYVDLDGRFCKMPHNDQASFSLAVEQLQINPFVLPLNWNYRPEFQKSFFGPVKIWHSYPEPPQLFFELAEYYRTPESIIQYHYQR